MGKMQPKSGAREDHDKCAISSAIAATLRDSARRNLANAIARLDQAAGARRTTEQG
jgi:hypothetical protein